MDEGAVRELTLIIGNLEERLSSWGACGGNWLRASDAPSLRNLISPACRVWVIHTVTNRKILSTQSPLLGSGCAHVGSLPTPLHGQLLSGRLGMSQALVAKFAHPQLVDGLIWASPLGTCFANASSHGIHASSAHQMTVPSEMLVVWPPSQKTTPPVLPTWLLSPRGKAGTCVNSNMAFQLHSLRLDGIHWDC